MGQIGDHVRAYNFVIEIAGQPVGLAKQIQGLDATAPPVPGSGGPIPGATAGLAGAGTPFGGQYYVNSVTHNVGGGQAGPPGGSTVPAQFKVIVLCGVLPTDQRGSTELSQWWGQKSSPQLGRRSVVITQRNSLGHELRRYSMDGWLVGWQGPLPMPGRPDPPPEAMRIEMTAANLRAGR